MQVVKGKFNLAKWMNIRYLFLDACYDEEDDHEKEIFEKSMEELYGLLERFPGLETTRVNDKV